MPLLQREHPGVYVVGATCIASSDGFRSIDAPNVTAYDRHLSRNRRVREMIPSSFKVIHVQMDCRRLVCTLARLQQSCNKLFLSFSSSLRLCSNLESIRLRTTAPSNISLNITKERPYAISCDRGALSKQRKRRSRVGVDACGRVEPCQEDKNEVVRDRRKVLAVWKLNRESLEV